MFRRRRRPRKPSKDTISPKSERLFCLTPTPNQLPPHLSQARAAKTLDVNFHLSGVCAHANSTNRAKLNSNHHIPGSRPQIRTVNRISALGDRLNLLLTTLTRRDRGCPNLERVDSILRPYRRHLFSLNNRLTVPICRTLGKTRIRHLRSTVSA